MYLLKRCIGFADPIYKEEWKKIQRIGRCQPNDKKRWLLGDEYWNRNKLFVAAFRLEPCVQLKEIEIITTKPNNTPVYFKRFKYSGSDKEFKRGKFYSKREFVFGNFNRMNKWRFQSICDIRKNPKNKKRGKRNEEYFIISIVLSFFRSFQKFYKKS